MASKAKGDKALAAVLASQGGPRGVAPTRLVAEPAFLADAKRLFWENQAREAVQYERLMYNLDPAASTSADWERLLGFRRLKAAPALAKADHEKELRKALRTIRYPDVDALRPLAGVEGLTLPALTTILHFHHPAYPIVSKDLVRGLNAIGYPVEYREDVSEESLADYAGILATLDRLKDRITFENVPESNCFLTRVLEGALVQTARSALHAAPAARARPPRRSASNGRRKPATRRRR